MLSLCPSYLDNALCQDVKTRTIEISQRVLAFLSLQGLQSASLISGYAPDFIRYYPLRTIEYYEIIQKRYTF